VYELTVSEAELVQKIGRLGIDSIVEEACHDIYVELRPLMIVAHVVGDPDADDLLSPQEAERFGRLLIKMWNSLIPSATDAEAFADRLMAQRNEK